MASNYSFPTTGSSPGAAPAPPPASPLHYAAALPPQDLERSAGTGAPAQAPGQPAPPAQPMQPQPGVPMPALNLQPAFPGQYLPMGTHEDAVRNMMAYRLAQQGHPADQPLPPLPAPIHQQGPTIDPRIRREMNAGHEGRR